MLTATTVTACSLFTDFTGLSEPEGSSPAPPTSDGGKSEGSTTPGDGSIQTITGNSDGGNGGLGDGGPTKCPSAALSIDSTFTDNAVAFDPWVGKASGLPDGYPKIESFFPIDDVGVVLIPAPTPEMEDAGTTSFNAARGGLWTATPVPTSAFDVELDFRINCPVDDCADGFAFAWLDIPGPEVVEQFSQTGNALGIPSSVGGGAFAADIFLNDTGEQNVPALVIRALDAAQPTEYLWTVAQSSVSTINNAWHKVTITVRGTDVSIGYDGAMGLFTGKVPSLKKAILGLTAATGGVTSSVAVRNFHGRFYDCTTP